MLSFLKKALSSQQTPEAMKAAASFVQQELRANKVAYLTISKDLGKVKNAFTTAKSHEGNAKLVLSLLAEDSSLCRWLFSQRAIALTATRQKRFVLFCQLICLSMMLYSIPDRMSGKGVFITD